MLTTVGELKAQLADWNDDTPLMHYAGGGLMEDGLDMRIVYMVDVIVDDALPLTPDNIASMHKDDPMLVYMPESRIIAHYAALGTQAWI